MGLNSHEGQEESYAESVLASQPKGILHGPKPEDYAPDNFEIANWEASKAWLFSQWILELPHQGFNGANPKPSLPQASVPREFQLRFDGF